eukprot:2491273-Rhodomonas_salina.1
MSGTGVVGATVRMYLEKYEANTGDLDQHPLEVAAPLLHPRCPARVSRRVSQAVFEEECCEAAGGPGHQALGPQGVHGAR